VYTYIYIFLHFSTFLILFGGTMYGHCMYVYIYQCIYICIHYIYIYISQSLCLRDMQRHMYSKIASEFQVSRRPAAALQIAQKERMYIYICICMYIYMYISLSLYIYVCIMFIHKYHVQPWYPSLRRSLQGLCIAPETNFSRNFRIHGAEATMIRLGTPRHETQNFASGIYDGTQEKWWEDSSVILFLTSIPWNLRLGLDGPRCGTQLLVVYRTWMFSYNHCNNPDKSGYNPYDSGYI